jgi:hypothetical protein
MDYIKVFNIPKVETDAPKAIEYAFPPNISVAASLNGATLSAKSSGDNTPNNEMQQKKVEKYFQRYANRRSLGNIFSGSLLLSVGIVAASTPIKAKKQPTEAFVMA